MTKYSIIFVITLFILNSDLIAQSFSAKIRKLSIEDGLSNRFVRRTFQDSKGFIWIGTHYGLNRYDGYSFEWLTKENEGLFSNIISNIYEDSDTCLWVTFLDAKQRPLEKVSIVDIRTLETQSLVEKFGSKFPIKEYEIYEIYQVAPRVIFIVTKNQKVFKYMGDGVCEELFELPYPSHTINNILLCKDVFWVIGAGYLLEYDKKGVFKGEELIPFKSILDVRCDNNRLTGYARYLQNDSLFEFSKSINEAIRYGAPPLLAPQLKTLSNTSKVHQMPNGLIWYNDQLSRFTSKLYSSKGELVYDFSNSLRSNTLRHSVKSIDFDANNNAWISTSNGVFILNVEPSPFHNYLNKNKFVPSSRAYLTRGMVEDDSSFLYVNSYGGRQKIDLKTGEVTPIEKLAKKGIPDAPDWPNLDAMRDRKGNFWFCGESNVVQCFDPKSKTMKEYPCKHRVPIESDDYKELNLKLHEDSRGRIWMGTRSGVYYLDTVAQAFIKFNAHGLCIKLNTSKVYALVEDVENGILWAGTNSGIYKFDYKFDRFTYRYSIDQKKPRYIPHDYILTIHKDKDCLWLGTYEGGLIKWFPETNKYEHFTIAAGLSDNMIYGILEDDNDNLWLSSNYGLMRFNKETKWCTTYSLRDGITANEFNKMAWYRSPTGRFYFGGINGIVAFYPNSFKEEGATDIPFHILSYKCWHGDVDAKELEDRTEELLREKAIVLEPNDYSFTLTFSLLDYRNPSQNRYAYKIENSAQEWQYTSENEVRINRLPYGEYTLIIKGRGANGEWSKNKIRIPIYVQIPFHETIYFFLLLGFLLILIFAIGARIFILNSRKNKKYLEQEIANRTQKLLEREQDLLKAKEEAEKSSHAKAEFLSIMSHEIRTPMNAVVNLTNYLLEDAPEERQIENLNILKFSANNLLAIINDVLDFNKIESGKVEFESIDFDLLGLLDSIYYGMAVNAKKRNIGFFLETDFKLSKMLIGDPNRLTQILNNLISNAIKFTEKGHVKLKLVVLEETPSSIKLRFEVEDTGIGISEEEKMYIFNMFTQAATNTTRKYGGTGLGLAITKRLLILQNSDIELRSKVGKGSTFSFDLNFKKGTSLVQERILGAPKETLGKDLKGVRVLVVEDNTVNVLVVKKFLQKWGVDFTHAADGLDAVEKVKSQLYDLILMDIHMPNMDGYVATKVIRSMNDGYYDYVPIIALTASALMDNKERIYDAGMNDIIVKPFNPTELYKILVKYLVKKI
ncbi:hybrid sensor histidine kinase/response regulator [Aureispira anguillae]|uniref:histidine kinase n=1 Tax=Aureispira anguillae TaxID=2864201 RepID=A0A915YF53_9BACT|nr:hybrid sensor histidine kinase/response regulator [Aureispira anguillae]BDS11902.1 ATP-binding protein [Aureispira anguillae]